MLRNKHNTTSEANSILYENNFFLDETPFCVKNDNVAFTDGFNAIFLGCVNHMFETWDLNMKLTNLPPLGTQIPLNEPR